MGSYYAGMMNATGGSYLRHYGILGMHWYIRRFQNPDGTLTPAGRKRYGYSSKKKGNEDSDQVPKSGMNSNSIKQRVGNWYKGRTTGETDSTKVSDRMLRWQMERNIYQNTQLQKNWDFSGQSAREERNLSKNFVKTVVKDFNNGTKASNDLWRKGDHEGYYKAEAKRRNDAKQAANNYIREVAKIRLKSMGYDVTNKAIDNLISKDWFRNSLWIQNTLASLGADGVNHTSKDDMMFR